jgi:hypothetical protein
MKKQSHSRQTSFPLKVSAILELAHTNNGGLPNRYIPYSLEAALLPSAMIKFHTPAIGLAHLSFTMYCGCCETNTYQDCSFFTMEQAMMVLPDAIFCH